MLVSSSEDDAKAEISRLVPEVLDFYWPMIARDMDSVRERWDSWYTKEALYDMSMAGIVQVWAAGTKETFHFVLFTQIANYPAGRHLQLIFTMGQELDRVLPLVEATLDKWGAMMGCTQAEVFGRKGWERRLKPLGFKLKSVTLMRPISQGKVH